jgi:hypothetical protein
MKRFITTAVLALYSIISFAQIGIGTTSPNTTLDVRGSLALNSRSFSTTTETVLTTDYTLLFTGTSACTLTLPDAITWPGRIINVKNTKTGTVPVLTIVTTSSQTIDGSATWLLDDPNETVNLVSDGSNWRVMGQGLPSGSGTSWTQGGNTVGSEKKLGTLDGYALPFFTNNTEKMRITTDGSVGIGTSTFDAINPERLIVDAGSSVSDFQNVIIAKGNTNNYVQFNIKNTSAGGQASTDIVATANNGSETSNYVDLGINSGNYNNGGTLLTGPNNGYLYSKGEDFIIGNASTSKSIIFFTGGDALSNEKFRLNSNGVVLKSDLYPTSDNIYSLGKSGARWTAVWAANGTIQTSDIRLKTNIQSLHYGLKEVMNMHPISYDWKNNPNSNHKIGLIAQEVRSVVPEVVIGDETKENLGMNYAELIPVLIKAIQEQQLQIEQLKRKVAALENK